MPRSIIPAESAPGPYAQYGRDVFLIAGDQANGNAIEFNVDDSLLMIAYNAGGSSATVTVRSWLDRFKRYRDITQAVAAGEYRVFGPFVPHGWRQVDNTIYVDVSSTNIQLLGLYVSRSRTRYVSIRNDLMADSQTVVISQANTPVIWR